MTPHKDKLMDMVRFIHRYTLEFEYRCKWCGLTRKYPTNLEIADACAVPRDRVVSFLHELADMGYVQMIHGHVVSLLYLP